ncbi:MAG TPA: flavin reductase family protein [Acidimicrobiia bacterium]|nr:flavin reductase family protein [Acidimicrobiia bacterium]
MIHDSDPFEVPVADRHPVRRFRGRLPAPVTVVTAGSGKTATGLTVSSLMVADGEPSMVWFLCGHNADLGDVIRSTGGFVVHALDAGDEVLADRFAGIRPSPGGLFADLVVEPGVRGPVLTELPNRLACRFVAATDVGWYLLIEGVIEDLVVGDPEDPLLRYRGHYRRLRDH